MWGPYSKILILIILFVLIYFNSNCTFGRALSSQSPFEFSSRFRTAWVTVLVVALHRFSRICDFQTVSCRVLTTAPTQDFVFWSYPRLRQFFCRLLLSMSLEIMIVSTQVDPLSLNPYYKRKIHLCFLFFLFLWRKFTVLSTLSVSLRHAVPAFSKVNFRNMEPREVETSVSSVSRATIPRSRMPRFQIL